MKRPAQQAAVANGRSAAPARAAGVARPRAQSWARLTLALGLGLFVLYSVASILAERSSCSAAPGVAIVGQRNFPPKPPADASTSRARVAELETLVASLRSQVAELENLAEGTPCASSREGRASAAGGAPSLPQGPHSDADAAEREDHHMMPHQHDGPPRVLVAVLSSCGPKAPPRRANVRQTWWRFFDGAVGKVLPGYKEASPPLHVSGIFFVGECKSDERRRILQKEMDEHGDIVYGTGYVDAYENLATKMIFLFQHVARHVAFDVLVKADDDSFLNAPGIVDALHTDANDDYSRLYMGKLAAGLQPQFPEEKELWNKQLRHNQFAPFMFGVTYMLSRDVVHFLAQTEVPFFPAFGEDTSVGLWVSPLELRRVDIAGKVFNAGALEADCKSSWVSYHYFDLDKAKKRMDNFYETGFPCQ